MLTLIRKYPISALCYIVLMCLIYKINEWMQQQLSQFHDVQIPLVHLVGFSNNPRDHDKFYECDEGFCKSREVTINGTNTLPKSGGAYIFYGSNIDLEKLPLPRQYQNIIWSIIHEESPKNLPEASHAELLSLFNYSSTFSRYSDVPMPLQGMIGSLDGIVSKRYFVETSTKNSLLNTISPIMYLQTNCDTPTERDEYVKKLMELISIDSYGACLNNKILPDQFKENFLNKFADDETLKFIARYKFVLAIENGVCDDYITEKLWRPIHVGSVPIYFGSPTIRNWLPNNKSAILLEDYPTPKLLTQHIKKLMLDDNLYEEHLEHKTKGIILNNRLINELKYRPYQTDVKQAFEQFICFNCKKLREMKKMAINSIVNKSHYNCPKPISALTLNINPSNFWVYVYEASERYAKKVYNKVSGNTTKDVMRDFK